MKLHLLIYALKMSIIALVEICSVNQCIKKALKFRLCPRQALHAQTLGFRHPGSGEQMDFTSPLPTDLQALINKWHKFTFPNEHLE